MIEPWEEELSEHRVQHDDQTDLAPGEESRDSNDLIRGWINHSERESDNRDSVITQFKSALQEAPFPSENPGNEVLLQNDVNASGEPKRENRGFAGSTQVEFRDLDSLENAIAERDETIIQIRDQLARIEASFQRQRAECACLQDWVARVEHRVDLAGCYDEVFNAFSYPREDDGGKPNAFFVNRKEDWEIEREKLLLEIEVANEEIKRLRATCDEPSVVVDPGAEALLESLAIAREDYRTLHDAYDSLTDQYEQLDNRHQKTIDELRAKLKEAELRERELAAGWERLDRLRARPNPVEADERIRAFRQHLEKIHQEESASRDSKEGKVSRSWFKIHRKRD